MIGASFDWADAGIADVTVNSVAKMTSVWRMTNTLLKHSFEDEKEDDSEKEEAEEKKPKKKKKEEAENDTPATPKDEA